jgi:ATP-binding cassette subfamily G (WHITE) protein 2 (SNQ2)
MGQGRYLSFTIRPSHPLFVPAIGHEQVQCSAVELVTITPPSGLTCGQYMDRFISTAGGYLTNPDAASSCQFCGIRTTDQLLGRVFDISYDHHWRNVGIMIAFFFFNVSRPPFYEMTFC